MAYTPLNPPGDQFKRWKDCRGPANRNLRRRKWYSFRNHYHMNDGKTMARSITELSTSSTFRKKCLADKIICEHMHPRAFSLIAKYGQDYTARALSNPHPLGEPSSAHCFGNAWVIMTMANNELEKRALTQERYVYVEGLVCGIDVRPMLHAWNSRGLANQEACDWTFYANCQWICYFGIPLTEHERNHAQKLIYEKGISLLFKKYKFPKVESYLIDLLQARAENSKR